LPLSERARVEVYLPDLPRAAYQDLLSELAQEFTYTFGGCTIIRGLDGSYLSQAGSQIQDRINLIYTDTPYAFEENFEIISTYADKLKAAVNIALEEEAVLITVAMIYHAE
jgi:3'-phosphoadenosine 5'-phosphosulfate sulfotransferase (PAPS reductase)/FAD synthetase